MRRIFLAVNLSDDIKETLGDFTIKLKQRYEVMRPSWVDPRSYHLTLHFFGEMDDAGLAAAAAGLYDLAGKITAPRLSVESLGYLPSGKTPRVLHLGFSMLPEGALDPVITAARRLAAEVGAEHETRPWLAHLTLARFKGQGALPASLRSASLKEADLPALPRLSFIPESFDLMESTLSPKGARHEIVRRFHFGK
ncbi:MAG TPA: RNA 2',3'-cyclic phosphodiesterase [Rectinemataceae bacterium]|nr:RNA 2',3'-cyclic phosphodiesterase [Rectinemataceae bacterium]